MGELGVAEKDRKAYYHIIVTEENMQKYVCDVCGYVYDPEAGDPDAGVNPGTDFANLPQDWVCPLCGAAKDNFSPASA